MLLDMQGVSFAYQKTAVLHGFSLQMQRGEHRLLLGQSGSGKTTLINLVSGLLTPDAGTISIAGEDMGGASRPARNDLRRRRIGLVFQTLRLVSALSLRGNLELAQKLAGEASDTAQIDLLLERLDLGRRANANPRDLSQGEAQRAAVARALIGKPDLLIADEPTSALDDANADRVAQLLLETAAETGATLLIATHDSRLKAHVAGVSELTALTAVSSLAKAG